MHIAGLVVVFSPEKKQEVNCALGKMSNVQVGSFVDDNKLVADISFDSIQLESETSKAIAKITGVLSTRLIYTRCILSDAGKDIPAKQ